MESFASLRRRTTEMLQSLPQSLPQLPSMAPASAVKGTWERIDVPPIPRSSHSIDLIGPRVYIFGGETGAGRVADNTMHVVTLPASGASADYYAIKPVAAATTATAGAPATPARIPAVVEPPSADEKEKQLDDVPLASPPPAPPGEAATMPLDKGKQPETASPPTPTPRDVVPAARAGHATAVIGHRIFLFGGRGGAEDAAAPLDEQGRVWVFDSRARSWTFMDPRAPTQTASPVGLQTPAVPPPRSGHGAVTTDKPRQFSPKRPARAASWKEWAIGDSDVVGIPQRPIVGNVAAMATDEDEEGFGTFIIHGGILADGARTNDVWAFDVRTRVWRELPKAPGSPRSGASLCISKSCMYRFGGFNGEGEEGGRLDWLSLGVDSLDEDGGHVEIGLSTAPSWKSITAEHQQSGAEHDEQPLARAPADKADWPGPRSAAGLETICVGGGRDYLLLVAGEQSPGSLGDETSAGQFWGDIWAFQDAPQGMTAASVTDAMLQTFGRKSGEKEWYTVDMTAYDDDDDAAAEGPGARGYAATTAYPEENALVVWGGLSSARQRLGDGWILRLGG